jgi:hypothetical protein
MNKYITAVLLLVMGIVCPILLIALWFIYPLIFMLTILGLSIVGGCGAIYLVLKDGICE